jgi:hypothetical protein
LLYVFVEELVVELLEVGARVWANVAVAVTARPFKGMGKSVPLTSLKVPLMV